MESRMLSMNPVSEPKVVQIFVATYKVWRTCIAVTLQRIVTCCSRLLLYLRLYIFYFYSIFYIIYVGKFYIILSWCNLFTNNPVSLKIHSLTE